MGSVLKQIPHNVLSACFAPQQNHGNCFRMLGRRATSQRRLTFATLVYKSCFHLDTESTKVIAELNKQLKQMEDEITDLKKQAEATKVQISKTMFCRMICGTVKALLIPPLLSPSVISPSHPSQIFDKPPLLSPPPLILDSSGYQKIYISLAKNVCILILKWFGVKVSNFCIWLLYLRAFTDICII